MFSNHLMKGSTCSLNIHRQNSAPVTLEKTACRSCLLPSGVRQLLKFNAGQPKLISFLSVMTRSFKLCRLEQMLSLLFEVSVFVVLLQLPVLSVIAKTILFMHTLLSLFSIIYFGCTVHMAHQPCLVNQLVVTFSDEFVAFGTYS